MQDEGTITSWLRHQHDDWFSNANSYRFPPVTGEGVTVECVKHPDKTVEVTVAGTLGRDFKFRQVVPPCDDRGLHVAVTWKRPDVNLYLNGKLVESAHA